MSNDETPDQGPAERDEELYDDAFTSLEDLRESSEALEKGEGNFAAAITLLARSTGAHGALIARLAAEVDRLTDEVEELKRDR